MVTPDVFAKLKSKSKTAGHRTPPGRLPQTSQRLKIKDRITKRARDEGRPEQRPVAERPKDQDTPVHEACKVAPDNSIVELKDAVADVARACKRQIEAQASFETKLNEIEARLPKKMYRDGQEVTPFQIMNDGSIGPTFEEWLVDRLNQQDDYHLEDLKKRVDDGTAVSEDVQKRVGVIETHVETLDKKLVANYDILVTQNSKLLEDNTKVMESNARLQEEKALVERSFAHLNECLSQAFALYRESRERWVNDVDDSHDKRVEAMQSFVRQMADMEARTDQFRYMSTHDTATAS